MELVALEEADVELEVLAPLFRSARRSRIPLKGKDRKFSVIDMLEPGKTNNFL